MDKISVVPVEDEVKKLQFIKFPFKLYKNEPNWVAPLIFEIRNNLDEKKNPFFKHSRIKLFLAYKNSDIVGRIAAIVNANHNEFHNDRVGFFGFFECINDVEVAKALFKEAEDFLEQNGMDTIRGPINLSTNDEIGLLVDSFDLPPVLMMPYNYSYYETLITSCEFKKIKDLFAYRVTEKIIQDKPIMDKLERVANIVLKREGLRIRQINLNNFHSELKLLREVYNRAWEYNWGFVPMTEEEFYYMAKNLKAIADPDYIFIAEKDSTPVGFSLTLLDYNQVFQKMNGRIFPTGIFKLLTGKRKINRIRVVAMGIVREFQKRGVEAVFIRDTIKNGIRNGIKECEISWVLEDNIPMVQTAENIHAQKYKTYRIFEKAVKRN